MKKDKKRETKSTVQAIKNEIAWGKKEYKNSDISKDYLDGFVKGLEQAIHIIKELDKIENEI